MASKSLVYLCFSDKISMNGPSQTEKNKDKSLLAALMLFLGAGALVYLYFTSGPEKSEHAKASLKVKSADYEKRVNQHLLSTNERMELHRKKTEVENSASIAKSYRPSRQEKYENSNHLDMSYDNSGAEVARELGRVRGHAQIDSPADAIQNEMYHQQMDREMEEQERIAYAQEFVDNARRGGWEVKLSPDLSTVISVRQIRQGSGSGFQASPQRGLSSGAR